MLFIQEKFDVFGNAHNNATHNAKKEERSYPTHHRYSDCILEHTEQNLNAKTKKKVSKQLSINTLSIRV